MAKKGQKFKVINESLMLKIVKEKVSGKSYSYLSDKYKVPIGSIKTWVRRFNCKCYINREKKGIKKRC